ncbi:hypothetical protein M3Y98_00851000 [Aphelenchoides besseyi]|nr:hypothetical protein M3Y98_00851000 [Aphelenchoides besseyi]KAI6195300.1 hypothetical protein M3Y96_01216200 [Aphelenchoides besseyi]
MKPRIGRFRVPITSKILSLLFLTTFIQLTHCSTPIEDFETCKGNEDYGQTGLICDPTHALKNVTIEKLDSLLRGLQNNAKRPAKCTENGNEPKKYVGLLQVTSSDSIDESGNDLKENAKQIYNSIPLGNTECDNGVLIFFIKDKQQLATYNGDDHFVQLTNADITKLHRLAGKNDDTGALALQFLRGDQDGEVQRAETWAPVVGLTAALVLILLLLAACLAFFLAKFCCCAGRSKKNKYYVTPMPQTYKTVDPIYIVTPPPSEHHGAHSDIIYSTPYSGTPLPPQSVFTVPAGYYPGAAETPRSNYGRSVTPTSTSRVRINGYPTSAKSADQTPKANKKDKINRTGTAASKHSNATYHTVNNSSATTLPAEGSPPQQNLELANRSAGSGDLSFLDPKRKQEIQTREDFIS